MYVKLLVGYSVAFVLLIGYLTYLKRRLETLQNRITDLEATR